MKEKIYLAGPMRGREDLNFDAFHKAAVALRAKGHEVFSPAEEDIRRCGGDEQKARAGGCDMRSAYAEDIQYICTKATVVCVLDGWELSRGACGEVAVADVLGTPVLTVEEILAGPV
jgi:nucleoside 2-deoxyribosyltransferase